MWLGHKREKMAAAAEGLGRGFSEANTVKAGLIGGFWGTMVNGVCMCARHSVLDLLEKVYPRPNKRRLAGVNGVLLEETLRRTSTAEVGVY